MFKCTKGSAFMSNEFPEVQRFNFPSVIVERVFCFLLVIFFPHSWKNIRFICREVDVLNDCSRINKPWDS